MIRSRRSCHSHTNIFIHMGPDLLYFRDVYSATKNIIIRKLRTSTDRLSLKPKAELCSFVHLLYTYLHFYSHKVTPLGRKVRLVPFQSFIILQRLTDNKQRQWKDKESSWKRKLLFVQEMWNLHTLSFINYNFLRV